MPSVALARTVPPAIVAALAAAWALPLQWSAWMVSALVLTAMLLIAMRAAASVAAALACVAAISLGYAACALVDQSAFGPVTRLGYPMLVATGLRVPGGICVLGLCGLVALVPALFPDGSISERS